MQSSFWRQIYSLSSVEIRQNGCHTSSPKSKPSTSARAKRKNSMLKMVLSGLCWSSVERVLLLVDWPGMSSPSEMVDFVLCFTMFSSGSFSSSAASQTLRKFFRWTAPSLICRGKEECRTVGETFNHETVSFSTGWLVEVPVFQRARKKMSYSHRFIQIEEKEGRATTRAGQGKIDEKEGRRLDACMRRLHFVKKKTEQKCRDHHLRFSHLSAPCGRLRRSPSWSVGRF